jgi:hypothetical protein
MLNPHNPSRKEENVGKLKQKEYFASHAPPAPFVFGFCLCRGSVRAFPVFWLRLFQFKGWKITSCLNCFAKLNWQCARG